MSFYRRTNSVLEFGLGVGFLAVALAILIARASPATGYEVSIYRSTPTLTWVLIGYPVLVATLVVVLSNSSTHTAIAAVLGGFSVTTIVCLPIVRGYHYLGSADPLTHLGWAYDLANEIIEPHSLFYPGIHSITLATARFTGTSLEHSMMLITPILLVNFLIFVPLIAKLVTEYHRSLGIAALVSWFLLPINNVATHLVPHTNSLALLYFPALLFGLILFLLSSTEPDRNFHSLHPAGIVLVILSFGLVVLHIQHAVNMLLLFVTICVVQFVSRRYYPASAISTHRPLYFLTVLIAGLVVLWVINHEIVIRELVLVLQGLGGDVGAAATVAQRTGSLVTVGGSVVELFLKMFFVSAVIGLVTAGYLIAMSRDSIIVTYECRNIIPYFTVALVPLGILFGVYFLGTPKMSFRQIGFIYVLLTILGAIAITHLTNWAKRALPLGNIAVSTILIVFLILSLVTLFGSPYIYIASSGVHEQEMMGYQTTFETRADEVPVATLSTPPFRYGDVQYGTTRSRGVDYSGTGNSTLSPEEFNAGEPTSTHPASRFYVIFTKRDRAEQFTVYNEINYQRSGLEAFEHSRQTNRVLANGEFELYLVTREESE